MNRGSTGNLQSQLGYQNQAAARKMMKMPNKSVELKVETKDGAHAKWTQLSRVMNSLIQRHYKMGLHKIVVLSSKHIYEDSTKRNMV